MGACDLKKMNINDSSHSNCRHISLNFKRRKIIYRCLGDYCIKIRDLQTTVKFKSFVNMWLKHQIGYVKTNFLFKFVLHTHPFICAPPHHILYF